MQIPHRGTRYDNLVRNLSNQASLPCTVSQGPLWCCLRPKQFIDAFILRVRLNFISSPSSYSTSTASVVAFSAEDWPWKACGTMVCNCILGVSQRIFCPRHHGVMTFYHWWILLQFLLGLTTLHCPPRELQWSKYWKLPSCLTDIFISILEKAGKGELTYRGVNQWNA